MELYVPWNDTWIYLPDLPKIEDPVEKEELIMSKTHIVSISDNARGSALLLLGGTFVNRKTMSEEKSSREVWRLLWDETSHSYSWTDQFDSKMGKREMTTVFGDGSRAAAVPDTFLSSFGLK